MLRCRVRGVRVEVSFGFLLMLCVASLGKLEVILLWSLLFMSLHECGHLAAMLATGRPPSAIRLRAGRVSIEPRTQLAGDGVEALILVSGVAVNLLLAAGFALAGREEFAAANLLMAGFNLVPAGELDGGRLFRLLLRRTLGERRGERACAAVSFLLSVALLTAGLLFLTGSSRNPTLLLASLYFFISTVQNIRYTF